MKAAFSPLNPFRPLAYAISGFQSTPYAHKIRAAHRIDAF